MENELTNALGRLRYSATDLFNSGVGAAQNATSRAQKGIAGLVHGAADTLDNAGRKLRKTGTKAVAGVQDIGSRAVSVGENVGSSAVSGVRTVAGDATSALGSAVGQVRSAVGSAAAAAGGGTRKRRCKYGKTRKGKCRKKYGGNKGDQSRSRRDYRKRGGSRTRRRR